MFLVDCCDVFTPGLIDLVTQPLAAYNGEMKIMQHKGESYVALLFLYVRHL